MKASILFAFVLLITGTQLWALILSCKDIPGLSYNVSVMPLNIVSNAMISQTAVRVMEIADDLYTSAEAKGRESIFPITGQLMQQLYQIDFRTGVSQVAFSEKGEVVGFALGFVDPHAKIASLEKFGVVEEAQGKSVGKRLMREFAKAAARAGAKEIQLLVRKGNVEAMRIYEHWGFINTTPEFAKRDPRANAFAYAVLTATLLAKTDPQLDR